jgi:hypothetical protein
MGDVGTDGVDRGIRESSPALALGVGAVAVLVVFLAANRLFVNLEGPFGEHALVGLLVSLAVAVVAGVLVTVVTYAVARRSRWGLVALAVVAFPTRIDYSTSFWGEHPQERRSCWGVTFEYYPPATSDAAVEVYCVGIERPRPAG